MKPLLKPTMAPLIYPLIKRRRPTLLMRFVVVGDIHKPLPNTSSTDTPGIDNRTGPPTEPIEYEDRLELLLSALEREKLNGVDFILFNGDIIHSGVAKSFLKTFRDAVYNRLNFPVYATCGNHDLATDSEWITAFGHGRSHHFSLGDYAFVLLQSSDTSGARQICVDEEFTENALGEYVDKKGVFAFSHIPRYDGIRPGSQYDSPTCDRILQAFESQKNLVAVFHSHFHEEDRVFNREGVKYCFTGHFAIYGLNYYGYRIVEIYDNSQVISTQYDVTNTTTRYTDTLR